MRAADADERLVEQVALQVDVQAKYAGYIDRQRDEIERQRRHEETAPAGRSRLRAGARAVDRSAAAPARVRPATLGQAARMPGITPAAISLLLVHLKRHSGIRSQLAG